MSKCTIGGALFFAAVVVVSAAEAGVRAYKNTQVYADESAWYVGSWQGTNTAFDPALSVEITILPSGEVYTYAHGEGKSYHVTTRKKVINVRNLPDTPMRGKMRDAASLILEDGGVVRIQQISDLLEAIVDSLGITVVYKRMTDEQTLAAMRQRVIDQKAQEAHHKDHDFWHSPEFWGMVAAGATAAVVTSHDDHVKVKAPGLSKSDAAALQKYYK